MIQTQFFPGHKVRFWSFFFESICFNGCKIVENHFGNMLMIWKWSPESGLYVSKKIRILWHVEMKKIQETCRKMKIMLKVTMIQAQSLTGHKSEIWNIFSNFFASNGCDMMGYYFRDMLMESKILSRLWAIRK